MEFDQFGNPIADPEETTGQLESNEADNADATGEEETVLTPELLTSDSMVDGLIADLLTDEEKTQLKKESGQPEEDPQEKPNDPTETEKAEKPPVTEKEHVYMVDGQEVTFEELKEKHIQKSKGELRQEDYTRKTQALADEKAKIAKFAVLNEHLERNPQDMQKVIDALKGQPKETPAPADTVPEDPIDAITHNATQAAVQQAEELVGGVRQEIQGLALQQQQERVKLAVQQDPLAKQTRESMAAYCFGEYKDLNGEQAAKEFMTRLDSDPQHFVKYYSHHRKKVEAATKPETAKKVVSREKKIPFVSDNDAVAPIVPKETKKRRDLKALRERTRGGKTEDVVRFLEASGMVDHLS